MHCRRCFALAFLQLPFWQAQPEWLASASAISRRGTKLKLSHSESTTTSQCLLLLRLFFFGFFFFSSVLFFAAVEATTEGPALWALGCGRAFTARGTPSAGPACSALLVSAVRGRAPAQACGACCGPCPFWAGAGATWTPSEHWRPFPPGAAPWAPTNLAAALAASLMAASRWTSAEMSSLSV